MKTVLRTTPSLALGFVAAVFLGSACHHTVAGVKTDAREDAQKAERGAEKARDATRDAVHRAGETVRGAGETVVEGAKDVTRRVRGTAKDMALWSAIEGDKSIESRHLDIDTDVHGKTITLRGSIPTVTQSEAVERIVKEKAPGYAVRNLLVIAKD
jgi:predicted small secreted protein